MNKLKHLFNPKWAMLLVLLLTLVGGWGAYAQAGINWTWRTTSYDLAWRSIAYGNSTFVAVAASGTGNRVMTSPDGINWTLRTSAADNQWFSVTYGGGLFVAVANSGTGNRVMTSPDGINWTLRTSAADNVWNSVTYGGGLFVAVAITGTGNRVMTSPDGINWTIRTSAADNLWYSVTYGNGLFVAVASSGTGNRVMTSPNGINWTIRTSAADNSWFSVTYGGSLFVAVAASGTGNRVMTSPDGINWTIRTSAADNQWYSVTYGGGLFVAVATTGIGNRVMTSPDGINWTIRTSAGDNAWTSVTYGGGLFVAVANSGTGNRVMTSPDGINWTAANLLSADRIWRSVTYGNGLFVAVAITGTGNRVMTSPDGINWTARTSAVDNQWFSVTYGGGLFVAVAYTGTGNRVMTSPDGINWTLRTSAADNQWTSVTYGGGLFVAVATTGIGNRVMTSPDGINWTIRTSAADNSWFSVTYGGGLFVAVAYTGTGNGVMTSSDGINWTLRTSAADNQWFSVTYGGGLFVAVAITGTGNRVMSSPDGITWTLRTSAVDNQWYSVTYGGGLFVAVAIDGTGNRVMSSPDGINWTLRTSAVDYQWTSVTYGGGLFVAVASSGTGNRVMTSGSLLAASVTASSPTSGGIDTRITITGTGFTAGSVVTVGGVAVRRLWYYSPTQIVVQVGDNTPTTASNVVVDGATSPNTFTRVDCAAPTGVSAVTGTGANAAITVNWTNPSAVNRVDVIYRLTGSTLPATEFTRVTTGLNTVGNQSFTLIGLNASTNYEVFVQIRCDGSTWSNWVSAGTVSSSAGTTCNRPTISSPANNSTLAALQANLTWSAVANATNYQVFTVEVDASSPVGVPVGGTSQVITVTTPSAFVNFPKPSTKYRVWVRANCSTTGLGEYTDNFYVTTGAVTACLPPNTFPAVSYAAGAANLADATLSWSGASGAAGSPQYTVHFMLPDGTIHARSTDATSMTWTGLNGNQTYQYAVRTLCTNGNTSNFSAWQSFTVPAIYGNCSGNVTGINSSNVTSWGAKLDWTPAITDNAPENNGRTYWVQYWNVLDPSTIYTVPKDSSKVQLLVGVHQGLAAGQQYGCRVWYLCNGTLQSYFNGANFQLLSVMADKTPSSPSTITVESESGLTIYPNPAKQVAVISYQSAVSSKQPIELVVVDALGREVYRETSQAQNLRTNLNVSKLAAGVYLIKVQDGEQTATKRLVVE